MKTEWILAAVLTLPGVALLGQQSGTANGNGAGQANQSTRGENHAMQTGSPNDNGAGLSGNYGKTQSSRKTRKKHHHHHKSRKYGHRTNPNQSGGHTPVHPG